MSESDKEPIVATLKVLQQCTSNEKIYPIYPGETTLGRAKDNAIVIRTRGISKYHACFLVEDGDHFVKDCDSKNNTYRKKHKLRPNVYYELVDKCELTFGDLKCQYWFNDFVDISQSVDVDSTVPYGINEHEEDSRGSTPNLNELLEQSAATMSDQLSHDNHMPPAKHTANSVSHSTTVPMAVESTVAYGDTVPYSDSVDAHDKSLPADSPSRSPDLLDSPHPLCPPPHADTNESVEGMEVGKETRSVPFKQTLLLEEDTPTGDKTKDSTLGDTYQDVSTLQYSPPLKLTKEKAETGVSSDTSGTVLYSEASTVDSTVPYSVDSTSKPASTPPVIDQTVPYHLAEDDDETDIEDGCDEESVEPEKNIDQTVPYELDEDAPGEVESEQQKETAVAGVSESSANRHIPSPKSSQNCSEEVPVQQGDVDVTQSLSDEHPSNEDSEKAFSLERKDTKTFPIVAESPDIQDPYELPGSDDNLIPDPVTEKSRKNGKNKGTTSSRGRKSASNTPKRPATTRTPSSRQRKSAKMTTPSLPNIEEESMDTEEPLQQPAASNVKGKGKASRSTTPAVPKTSTKVDSPLMSSKGSSNGDSSGKACVLFTGVEDKESERVIASLGGKMADNVYECSHLVTDKMRRTMKFLCCVARGCHIVNFKWIEKCNQQKKFVDSSSFTLKDKAFEKQHNFNLVKSIAQARANPGVLTGYQCVLSKGVKPNQEQLRDIIKCAGGSVLASLPDTPEKGVVVISTEEDMLDFADAQDKGFPIYTTEFVFSGILKQELSVEENRLTCSKDSSSSQSKTGTTSSSHPRKRQANSSGSRSKRTRK